MTYLQASPCCLLLWNPSTWSLSAEAAAAVSATNAASSCVVWSKSFTAIPTCEAILLCAVAAVEISDRSAIIRRAVWTSSFSVQCGLRAILTGRAFAGCKLRWAAQFPLRPVVAEQFDGMRRSNASVAARQRVGRAVLVATPADPLGAQGLDRERFWHVLALDAIQKMCEACSFDARGVLTFLNDAY